MSINISDKAMLVSLSISAWTARKLDKKVTREVAERNGTTEQWGRYNKTLIAEEETKKIQAISNDVRQFHYKNTLPWSDQGDRLLPAANYLQYTEAMREFRGKFESAVDSFCAKYPDLVAEAKVQLNGLFNADDYPSPSAIHNRFSFAVDVSPLPVAADFRVTLNDDEVATIKNSIEKRSQEKLETATRDLWQRLYEAINHMAKTLRDPEKIFKNTLVSNVQELANLLPRLNVTNDPKLAELCNQAKDSLCSVQPDALRNDSLLRAKTANNAADVLNALNGYIGQ
jgi:hypothetical protein